MHTAAYTPKQGPSLPRPQRGFALLAKSLQSLHLQPLIPPCFYKAVDVVGGGKPVATALSNFGLSGNTDTLSVGFSSMTNIVKGDQVQITVTGTDFDVAKAYKVTVDFGADGKEVFTVNKDNKTATKLITVNGDMEIKDVTVVATVAPLALVEKAPIQSTRLPSLPTARA